MKIYVIDRNNLINLLVLHWGLDHLVTDFIYMLSLFVFSRFSMYFKLLCDILHCFYV